jgi:hypothetical protein
MGADMHQVITSTIADPVNCSRCAQQHVVLDGIVQNCCCGEEHGFAYNEAEQNAFAQAVREWKASGERFSAAEVLARRDEILASR